MPGTPTHATSPQLTPGMSPAAWAGATAFFVALTVAFTWPQVVSLRSLPDHHDPLFSVWRLEWFAHQFVRDPRHLFDANVFWPATRTLAYSDATLLQAVVAAPWLWAGASGVVVYNALVLASFPLAALLTCWAVVRWSGSLPAGLVAGTIAAFAAFRLDHYIHLELLYGWWVAPALVYVRESLETHHRRAIGLAVLCLAGQVVSCIYYGVFLSTLTGLWIVGLIALGEVGVDRRTLRTLTTLAIATGILVLPYGIPYALNARELGGRTLADTAQYSATLTSYLSSTRDNIVYAWTYARWGATEQQLFPGLVAALLASVAVIRTRQRRVWLLAALLGVAVDLSLGMNGVVFPLLRSTVPVYEGLRVPARAGGLVLSLVALLAGLGVASLLTTRWFGATRLRRATLATVLIALVSVEYAHHALYLVPTRDTADAVDTWLARQPATVVLELPLPDRDRLPGREVWYQYRSTLHWQRLANGYSGFYPPAYLELLTTLRRFPDEATMAALKRIDVGLVVVHEAFFAPAALAAFERAVVERRDLERIGRFATADGRVVIYRVTE